MFFTTLTSANYIYKCFIRSHLDHGDVNLISINHLDHGDVIYDQPSNATFSSKIESIQYNAAIAIIGAIRDSSREKLYQELGLEYLHGRRWMRHLCLFYKVLLNKVLKYIYELIPPFRNSFRNPNSITSFTCRTGYFKNSFFPSVINDWNKVDPKFAILLPILVSKMP